MKVKILKYDDLGNGIGYIDNKVCFVKKAIPGEILDIKIIKENKKYSKAIILDILEQNTERIEPLCPFYNQCGGCNFLHITKSEEIKFKNQKIKNYFNKIDKFYETKEYSYRNKVTFHVHDGSIGFYNEKSNNLVKVNFCYLISLKMNNILKIFNENKDNNFNGKILVRENYNLETIVSIEGDYKYINKLINSLLIDNLIYNSKIIKGNDYFIEKILSYKFKVNYKSFFQINNKGLEIILTILKNYLKDKKIDTVLDLYSGTSVLGIGIANYVNNVISIEVNYNATSDAKENVIMNKVNNLEIINGLVEDYIDQFKDIDLMILDPARRGLDKKTIKYLNEIKPNYLVYIACGIDSLKRDLKMIDEKYQKDYIYGIDMFPRTNNIETIIILKKIS